VEFADWTLQHAQGARWAKLLRDLDDEHRFISFRPWESIDAIEAWRGLDGWRVRVDKIAELLARPRAIDARAGRRARIRSRRPNLAMELIGHYSNRII
jgi:quinol monooxygenase YgiN